MRWLLNAAYVLLLVSISPVITWRMFRHGRYRQGLAEKVLGRVDFRADGRPVVWFHAVSVGEVIQLQKVVDEFRRRTRDEFQIVVSTSTDTGWELVQKRFADCQKTWFPLDFSWAVSEAIRRIRPAQVVLMELELWPNFLAECHRLDVPVSIINARMSERSHRGYCRIRLLLKPLFTRLALVAISLAGMLKKQSCNSREPQLELPNCCTRFFCRSQFLFAESHKSNDSGKTQNL